MIRPSEWLLLACTAPLIALLAFGQDTPQAIRFQRNWNKAKALALEQSISGSKDLSDAERSRLVDALASQLRPSMSYQGIKSEKELRDATGQYRVEMIDLRGDSKETAFAVQGVGEYECSPTGNCGVQVFRPSEGRYSVVLQGTAQSVWIWPTQTNGFYDIVLGMHGSATSTGLKLYKFDGSRYHRMACYNADFQYLGQDGEIHELENPRITPCGQQH